MGSSRPGNTLDEVAHRANPRAVLKPSITVFGSAGVSLSLPLLVSVQRPRRCNEFWCHLARTFKALCCFPSLPIATRSFQALGSIPDAAPARSKISLLVAGPPAVAYALRMLVKSSVCITVYWFATILRCEAMSVKLQAKKTCYLEHSYQAP